MKPFVFSCDAHIVEPLDLFTKGMPAHLQQWAPKVKQEDGWRYNLLGETLLFKLPVGFHAHKVGDSDDLDIKRLGMRDLKLRAKDMQRDGVDAELVFPSLGLLAPRITDAEAAVVAARLYNDWAWDYTEGVRNKLLPAAMMPLVNIEDGITELKRVISKGYKAVMMPTVPLPSCPRFNDPAWDAFFKVCADAEIPLCFHTGVGDVALRAFKGPGAALCNYTRQMDDATGAIMALVGGGLLDRIPQAHILFVECGAGWLLGLAERMDEVYYGHAPSVQPKLSRKPSEIVRDQVHLSFQNDPGCLLTVPALSIENFLFASDYPHSEGTFPNTMKIINAAFTKYPHVTEDQRAAVLGGNAARMFKIDAKQVALETEKLLQPA